MYPKRTTILITALALASLFASQCAKAPAATQAPAQVEATSAPQAQATSAPAETSAPATKRVLRVTFSWPTYIDPAVGNDFSSSTSLANLYDTLIFPNPQGGMDPWLAESWDVSDDGLTYTFHLRQGVKFHDGSELKASDVVFSYTRFQTIGEGFAYLITGVENVTAPDDYTVVFKLANPSGLFVPSLVRLYVASEKLIRENTKSEGPYGESGDYGKDWLLTHDAGSGPYKVKEFPLEEYLLMEKNNDWWGKFADNAPDEMRFIATTETATVRALMSTGQLEITDQWQTVDALKALGQIPGVQVATLPTMTSFYFMVNTRMAPTDDLHCRRAMAWAFDYDAAVGLEWQGTKQMVGPVPASLAGHDPSVFTFHRDLDKAREELSQCAYAKDIASHPVEFDWISEVPDEEKYALLFQANMAEIGVPVKIVSKPWLSVVEDTSTLESSPNVVSIYVSADLSEAGLMLQQRYDSSTANTWQQNEWLQDPKFDAEIKDALSTVDPQARYKIYASLQAYIADLAPSIFVYDQVEKHAYHADYVDWPGARGEASAVMGYQIFGAQISVDPSKMPQ